MMGVCLCIPGLSSNDVIIPWGAEQMSQFCGSKFI